MNVGRIIHCFQDIFLNEITPEKINAVPSMSKTRVGVKLPEAGTPDSVAGMATRGLMVAEEVAVKAGTWLTPAASTIKFLCTFWTTPLTTVEMVIVCSPGGKSWEHCRKTGHWHLFARCR